MKTYYAVTAAVLISVAGSSTVVCADPIAATSVDTENSPQQRFDDAFLAESADRDLEKAILLYREVVDQGGDAMLVERAQLRIGICYEHLGKVPEAMDAYEAVIHQSESTTDDMAQTANQNLKRLEAKLQQERAAELARAPASPPIRIFLPFYHRLDVTMGVGPSYSASQTRGFDNGQFNLWASVRYRFSDVFRLGVEGAYWQPSDDSDVLAAVPGISLTQDDNVQSYYFGPFGEWAWEGSRLSLLLQTGFGFLFQNEDDHFVLQDPLIGSTSQSFTNFSSSLASSSLIGIGWHWGPRARLELCQRVMIVRLPSQGDIPDALQPYAPSSPVRWRALFTPTLQFTWHFGSDD